MEITKILKSLDIEYKEVEHEAVFTSLEAQKIKKLIAGVGVKNLFLKSKGTYYLVLIKDHEKADLKMLEKILNVSHLSFANEEELMSILGLKMGSVSPLGIINDKEGKVKILISEELKGEVLLMHPLINTRTLAIRYEDLIKFINYCEHEYLIIH